MNDPNCVFCKILAGEIPGKFVYRDDDVAVLEDVNPQAPSHLLVMPVKHVPNLEHFTGSTPSGIVAKVFETAARIGAERGPSGFRAVINTGPEGGQTVDHLHVHVLAGRTMTWPPG